MANADIAKRLLDEMALFEAGQIDVLALQSALLIHGNALEGMPRDWQSRLARWDGELEMAIFAQGDDARQATAARVVQEARQALSGGGQPLG